MNFHGNWNMDFLGIRNSTLSLRVHKALKNSGIQESDEGKLQ